MKNQNLNLFVAVLVVIGFVLFWDTFVVSRYAPAKTANKTGSESIPKEFKLSTPAPGQVVPNPSSVSPLKSQKENVPIQMKVLENSSERVTFETQGAKVISWEVKEKNHWVQLVGAPNPEGKYPLESFPSLNFSVDSVGAERIVFSTLLPNGVQVLKTFDLGGDSVPNKLTFSFTNNGKATALVDDNLEWAGGIYRRIENGNAVSKDQARVRAEIRALGFIDRIRSWKPGAFFGKVKDEIMPGPFRWVGVDNEHFLAAVIPENNLISSIRVIFDKTVPPSISIPLKENLGPKETRNIGFKIYVGPKKLEDLEKVGFDLKYAIDYGFLEKILLASLQFFYRFIHNYGWSIILLTICIQLLMYPLTRKSLQSSLKMKEIQPQIKKIQEQFKKDPQRLHIETMNIYKKHGMKFMGMEGCLPLIIQMPIFFAIFKMLRSAYDLRGAPWILWIKDLSAADPFYVLPILMGVGMFIQQKTTTVSVDPAQAKMMYIFPVILTFMFSSMPAGLVIYWIVQSAATIIIQKFLTLHLAPKTQG